MSFYFNPKTDYESYLNDLLEGINELEFIQSHIGIIKDYEENRSWKP